MNPVGHVDFTAELLAATECERGDLLVYDSTAGYWEVATTAARGMKRSEAIALTDYGGSMVGKVAYQAAGIVAASVSGLGAGVAISSAASWVRCSATGTMERCTPADGDDIIGRAEADGRVHLMFGILTDVIVAGGGGATPGGSTGSVQANDGAGGLTGYSTVLLGSGFISTGSDPSTFGAIRLSYGASGGVYARNSTDNGNANVIGLIDGTGPYGLGNDLIQVGDGSYNLLLVPGVGRTLHVWSDDYKFNDGNGSEIAGFDAYGLQLGATTPDFGAGEGVFGLKNAALVPSTNPTDGVIVYAESDVLKYRKSDGAIVTIGSAPTGTCTLEEFGAVGDGVTNDTAAWTAALDAMKAGTYSAIILGAKTYLVSGYAWDGGAGNGGAIIGQGPKSVLKVNGATTSTNALLYIINTDSILLRDFTILGDGVASQRGVLLGVVGGTAPRKSNIENVHFLALALQGANCGSTTGIVDQIVTLVGCRFDACGVGIVCGGQLSIIGCNASNCAIGIQVSSGNLCAVGSVFDLNTVGVQLEFGGNDGHGFFTGCTINHNTTAINVPDGLTYGMTFSGCHIYANGTMSIKDNAGIIDFTGCGLRPQAMTFDNCLVRFTDCRLETLVIGAVTYSNNPTVIYSNCLDLDATVPTFISEKVQCAFTFSGDANQTLTNLESQAETVIIAAGAISTTRDATIDVAPAGAKSKRWLFINNNAQVVNVKFTSGTAVAVAAGAKVLIGSDGTNAITLLS